MLQPASASPNNNMNSSGSLSANQNCLKAALIYSNPAKQWKDGKRTARKVMVIILGAERSGSNSKLPNWAASS